MTSYITVAQVKNALRNSYDGSDDSLITGQIIPACSAFLDTYCGTPSGSFLTTSVDELLAGTGEHFLYLTAAPVQSIQRIAINKLPAVSIHNLDSDMGTRATVALSSSGLTLTYIKAAVTTTNTLAFSSYTTVTALVNAINALGNFWQANVMGGFGNWSTSDLWAPQGAFGARITTCYLWLWWQEIPSYIANVNNGEIQSEFIFTRGPNMWRATYTAGYATFPDDLTQALAEMCAQTYYAREGNSNFTTESNGEYSYTRLALKGFEGLSDMARRTLNNYKRRRVFPFSSW